MKSYLTVTDQFCGAGGSSLGAISAGAEVKLAMNHWKRAIETYSTNHPDTDVACTDISACDPRRYQSTDVLITSPECTNHSLAKGRQRKLQAQLELFGKAQIDPAEERSRATMWDVPRFAEVHNYNSIIVENVVDARHWRLFDAWLHAMRLLDYDFEIVYLNSMFAHPTPQSRDRMYVVFWKHGNRAPDLAFTPPAFCPKCGQNVGAVQSWKNPAKRWGRYGKNRQYVYRCPTCASVVEPYYYCAANAIDWSLPAERIGDRARPLKEKTLSRIKVGLEKYGRHGLMVNLTQKEEQVWPLTNPAFTQVGSPKFGLVAPFLVDLAYTHGHERRSYPVDHPWPTQTGGQTLAFIVSMRDAPNYPLKHITDPLPTQSTVGAPYLVELYGQSGAAPITNPIGSQLTTPHHGLVMPYLVELHGTSEARPVTDALATVTTLDRHALVEPSEPPKVEDCYFRMLKSHEIGRAMAFPDTYVVTGNERDKVRQYGNAVTPPAMRFLLERCIETFR